MRAETVTAWVGNDYLPGGEQMTRLPGLLGCDGHWLLTGEGDMVRQAASMKEMRADYIARVITGDLDDAVVAEIGPKGRMRKATGRAGMRPGKRKVKAEKGAED